MVKIKSPIKNPKFPLIHQKVRNDRLHAMPDSKPNLALLLIALTDKAAQMVKINSIR